MIKYKPNPIETSTIVLSDDLLKLQDKLAENVHENWAKLRIAEGWAWGGYRDDAAKKHPNLVTYQELPESEKVYDRKVAIETIKAIIALGYRIERI
jgi:ryanodine receptor 2